MRIAIIGAAELGKLIARHAVTDQKWSVVGYYDDFFNPARFNDSPVLGKVERTASDFEEGVFDALMIGIGYNHMKARSEIFERFKGSIPFANLIHSSAYVDPSCKLGEGIFLLPGVIIDAGCIIEDNVLVNTGGIIAHDSKVEAHSFLGPAVHIAGLTTIGKCSFLGTGTTVIDCLRIGEHAVVGAGSVVISDVPEYSVSVGVPSRVIQEKKP